MSGHSKWANIKHKKQKVDAQRGKIFGKLIRAIMVAAREGGGDPEANPRLRAAVDKAREYNMPMDNIKRAIQKGTGELSGVAYEEIVYEGYGPGGVAVMVEVLTDNRKRTAAEMRHIFSRHGGSLGENGCVAWMFTRKGYIYLEGADEEAVMEVAIDAGAEDVKTNEDGSIEVTTDPKDFQSVKQAFEDAGISMVEAKVTMIPQSTVKLEGKDAEHMMKLMEELEEHDDVQEVYANFDIPDEIMEKMAV
ncbi:MAG: YebC/PmpR family DNA-binding transcriptional regulator [Synergistetes bacterium]|nr:YebC/PmpR family DNA-binding transcriptional regulator [Synergistota bacterium]